MLSESLMTEIRDSSWIPVAILISGLIAVYQRRRDLYMLTVPDMHTLPINTTGYTIERLPFQMRASFVRGTDLYFSDDQGVVYWADDRDPHGRQLLLGKSRVSSPRMLFVSSNGTLFIGGQLTPLMERSIDGGKNWEQILPVPTWRMDENETTNTLYVGNYSPRQDPDAMATLYKSTDEGATWQPIFENPRLDHIHTVRVDPEYHRIYLAAGDESSQRGQAWTDNDGENWHWIDQGKRNGHTDLTFSRQFVFWGSDDWYGRIIRSPRNHVGKGKTILFAKGHHIWWIMGKDQQLYAGTFLQSPKRESGAFLIASDDEGQTWQKVMESKKAGSDLHFFRSESRILSSGGWAYFSTSEGQSYRIRKT